MVEKYIGILKYSLDRKSSKIEMTPKHVKTYVKLIWCYRVKKLHNKDKTTSVRHIPNCLYLKAVGLSQHSRHRYTYLILRISIGGTFVIYFVIRGSLEETSFG